MFSLCSCLSQHAATDAMGHSTATIERLAALRAPVGAGFEIFTDANQAFAVDEAIRRARLYEAADIGWFQKCERRAQASFRFNRPNGPRS